MRPTSYLRIAALSALTMLVATVAITVIVDPYRVFGSPTAAGWNALKPRVYEQANLAKTYQLARSTPATLILGNSRSEIGLDPQSLMWPQDARPVFNAAQAGTDLFVAWDLLRDVVATNPPKTVVVGLDIVDFLQAPRPQPATRRLPRPIARMRDYLSATLTIDALIDSVMTVFDQDPGTSATMTADGFNPMHEIRAYQRRTGHYGLFVQKNRVYEAQFQRLVHPDFSNPASIANFRALDGIVELARLHKSRVILFIHPYHAQFLDLLRQAGYGPDFEAWKQALARHFAGTDITILDFSAANEVTTELVPPSGDLTEMRWYWESGHYKPAAGNKMIARFVGADKHFGETLVAHTEPAIKTANDPNTRPTKER